MTQDIGKIATPIMLNKSQMASSKYTDEVRIITRGQYYLTPFTTNHIDEVVEHLSKESRRELRLLGHLDIPQAIEEMQKHSECYIARKQDETFLAVGGLWYDGDQDFPQMFAMFSKNIKGNFNAIARGSLMIVKFFDSTQTYMSMTILADYEFMLDWASWLGFEEMGVSTVGTNKYVDFVRCNPNENNVRDGLLRPVTH